MSLKDANGANPVGLSGGQGNDQIAGSSPNSRLQDAVVNTISDITNTVYMPGAPTHNRGPNEPWAHATGVFNDPAASTDASATAWNSAPGVVITATPSSAQSTISPFAPSKSVFLPDASSHSSGLSKGQLFAAIFFPIAVVLATATLCLFYFRIQRKRRAGEARELKDFPPSYGGPATVDDRNVCITPATLPQSTPAFTPSYYAPALQPANGMNYQEDPPPPYQPSTSSVVPESPPQGLLHPQPRRLTESNLFTHSQANNSVSPFADPADEDAVSDISEPVRTMERHRDGDEHSIVSDISHEGGREPGTHHVV
ncbi:MAG: hypothetical protein M1835_007677 [Candelina submexicana]|nr:MAG: hypothetical protein M1835_007677 [Candelina submexicana]